MKRIAVLLCGCGSLDGSEIHEATLTLLAIDECGAEYRCFAPDIPQARVMNFITGEPLFEQRNQLLESARIARGDISPLTALEPDKFDAIIVPGGGGSAYNLANFALAGSQADVLESFADILRAFAVQGKPIGAICIAPALVALALKGCISPELTLGLDTSVYAAVEVAKLGCSVYPCPSDECIVDAATKVVTSPAYMNDARIAEVRRGILSLVQRILELA